MDSYKIYRDLGSLKTEYANQADILEYSDSSPRNTFQPRGLREQARDLRRDEDQNILFNKRSSYSPPPSESRSSFNALYGFKADEKGINHYKKSGILQRNFDKPEY